MHDAVVIGAGAAGIAAARRLAAAGRRVIVLEARRRIGGRAWTVHLDGHPADLGCAWLHDAEHNGWAVIAQALGLALNRDQPDWGRGFVRERQLAPAALAARDAALAAFWDAFTGEDRVDRPLAAALVPDDPWAPALAALASWVSGAGPEALSLLDLQRYRAMGANWRVVAGYGHLVERHAAGLDIRLGMPVTALDWGGDAVRLVTPVGTLAGRTAIVTVPTPLLLDGSIRFRPALPDARLAAAAGLPLGQVAKLYLGVAGQPFDLAPDRQVLGAPNRRDTGNYHLHPLGRPLVEAFYGGTLAVELERAGSAAMAAFALDELAGLFGHDIRRRLRPLRASGWLDDPYAQGAYSYARPGAADGRAVLAAPLDGCLFFAGEACSTHAYSTAHGAYDTGIAAAEAALRALGGGAA